MNEYREVDISQCRGIITTHHYSRRMPSTVKLAYGHVFYKPKREIVACCIFSTPVGRWETNSMWELTRLVRLPNYDQPLTKLISKAVGEVRKTKGANLLISLADAEESHHGGVYQACSWLYSGMREARLDGFNIDGLFVPARTCVARWRTMALEGLRAKVDGVVEPHYDEGKHLYWKALTKDGMQTAIKLGLVSVPYPKPMLVEGVVLAPTPSRKGRVELPAVRREPATIERIDLGASVIKKKPMR